MFIEKTFRGAEALADALETAFHQPERLAAFAAHDTAFIATLLGKEKTARVARSLMYPLLSGAAIRARKPFAGLALAGAAARELTDYAGAAQYTGYALALREKGAKPHVVGAAVRGVLVLAGLATSRKKAETAAVGIPMMYATEIANDPALETTPATQGLCHGANLLVAAEACRTLGVHKLVPMTLGFVGNLLLIDGLVR